MELTVNKENLVKELNHLSGIRSKEKTMPILSNLLLVAYTDSLEITATDLNVSLVTRCDISAKKKGSLTIPADRFLNVIKLLPDSEIKIKSDAKDQLHLNVNGSQYKFLGMPSSDFPVIGRISEDVAEIPGEVLSSMIRQVLFAAYSGTDKPVMNGALLQLEPRKITMAATDGHRLAISTATMSAEYKDVKAVIPTKCLQQLMKLIDGGAVQFSSDGNHVYFKIGNRFLSARMIAGQFPNYELVIPQSNDKYARLNTAELVGAIKRVAVMATEVEKVRNIKLVFTPDRLTMMGYSAESGEAQEFIGVEYDDRAIENVSIAFNPNYLLDFLAVCPAKKVVFNLKDGETQSLIQPDGIEGYRYILMPMRF